MNIIGCYRYCSLNFEDFDLWLKSLWDKSKHSIKYKPEQLISICKQIVILNHDKNCEKNKSYHHEHVPWLTRGAVETGFHFVWTRWRVDHKKPSSRKTTSSCNATNLHGETMPKDYSKLLCFRYTHYNVGLCFPNIGMLPTKITSEEFEAMLWNLKQFVF